MDNGTSNQRKVIALKIMAMYRERMTWPGAKIESSTYFPFFTLPKKPHGKLFGWVMVACGRLLRTNKRRARVQRGDSRMPFWLLECVAIPHPSATITGWSAANILSLETNSFFPFLFCLFHCPFYGKLTLKMIAIIFKRDFNWFNLDDMASISLFFWVVY